MKIVVLTILAFVLAFVSTAQEREQAIFKSLQQELYRNIAQLAIDDAPKPCYIAYTLEDKVTNRITSQFGGITESLHTHTVFARVDVLIGTMQLNNNSADVNIFDAAYLIDSETTELPVDLNDLEIRRLLWIATDRAYKNAINSYKEKMANRSLMLINTKDSLLADFSYSKALTPIVKPLAHPFFNEAGWTERAKRISALFTQSPHLVSNELQLTTHSTHRYFVNSEGTVIATPHCISKLTISATNQLDEEIEEEQINYVASLPSDFPTTDSLAKDCKDMIARLNIRETTSPIDESYEGPVLFIGNQVAQLLTDFICGSKAIITRRIIPGYTYVEGFEGMIGRRILPKELSITAIPSTICYKGAPLVGNYSIDGEGVEPDSALLLVKQGIVQRVMSSRTPSQHTALSNGHMLYTSNEFGPSLRFSAGIAHFSSTASTPVDTLREHLIKLAKEEGYNYAYIVKGNGTPLIYRISTIDGSETLSNGAEVERIILYRLKRMAGISSEEQVTNIYNNDIALSIIHPQALLLEDISITAKEERITEKRAVVNSPISNRK